MKQQTHARKRKIVVSEYMLQISNEFLDELTNNIINKEHILIENLNF